MEGTEERAAPEVTRFAPSPTGRLHAGNARVALLCWAAARASGGRFLLRIDDTDPARSREELVAAIREDLDWLGLDRDGEIRQSARAAVHRAAAERLRAAGHLYECFETAEELAEARAAARRAGRPPLYDRAALRLDAAARDRLRAARGPGHWRFRLAPGRVDWQDAVLGPVSVAAESLSDPVVVRSDGSVPYLLASVADDIDTGVTLVIRGADHVTNSAVQLRLLAALGAAPPRLAHVGLLALPGGAPLSKRAGAASLADLRAGGIEPLALLSLLARIGSADPVEPRTDHAALVRGFDLARIGAGPASLDPAELDRLNARVLHALPHRAVADRLAAIGVPAALAPAFWEAVRDNLARFDEARDWWAICAGRAEYPVPPEERDFVAAALALLPPKPWDGETWGRWTRAVAAATGRRGRDLHRPLRLALTGRAEGPAMARLMPLLGAGG